MKKQTTITSWSYPYYAPCNPQAFISVKNNRMKHYVHEGENRLYLEDGTEFQLEFYNDSNEYVKADITINGVKESSALVLRPNQRFYLDRFMDEKKKFKFNTFMTGNDDIEKMKEIIEKNGRIKVEFYQEEKILPISWCTTHTLNGTGNTTFPDILPFFDGSQLRGQQESLTSGNIGTANCFYSQALINKERREPKEIETGRIEAGKKSKQDFVSTDKQFNIFPTKTFEYHIMPVSQKPKKVKKAKKKKDVIVADSIREYCPVCGRRCKKGWNFCPGCGKQF